MEKPTFLVSNKSMTKDLGSKYLSTIKSNQETKIIGISWRGGGTHTRIKENQLVLNISLKSCAELRMLFLLVFSMVNRLLQLIIGPNRA